MKYDVHIYAIVRVRVGNVEAESQKDALVKAEELADLNSMFRSDGSHSKDGGPYIGDVEYADDIDGFVVDEVGDKEYANSCMYDKHGELQNPMG